MIGINSYLANLESKLNTVQAGVSSPFTNSQTFTSSGTWTRPSNVDWVYVILVGGGGGGGCYFGSMSGPFNTPGSGGGSGSWIERWVKVTGNVSVVIGGGGGLNGGGGISCFDTIVVNGGGSGSSSICSVGHYNGGFGLSPGSAACAATCFISSSFNNCGWIQGSGGVTPYGYGNGGHGQGCIGGNVCGGSAGTSGLCIVFWRQ